MTQETSKVYDIAFRMGVLFNILLFTILNIISSEINRREFENSEIWFAPAGYNWGFPFNWGENYWIITEGYSILNIIAAIFGSLFFGFLFKLVWSIISRRSAEFNGASSS